MKSSMLFVIFGLSTFALPVSSLAANSVKCNMNSSTAQYAVVVREGATTSSPGANTPITSITIQIYDQGIVDYFAKNGFELPNGPTDQDPNSISVETTPYDHVPYSYYFVDQRYGKNASWDIHRENNGLKIVASNPYTHNSVNWYFNNCDFQ
jgi:hypothetical protein